MSTSTLDRASLARQGLRLEYFTIAWNLLEAAVAITSGILAGSISLLGFGIDSLIEVTSGTAVLWRMAVDANQEGREVNERRALRVVGACFLGLAIYITYECLSDLLARRAPERSIAGVVLACVSLLVMPPLSRAKKRVGVLLGSAAMHADARQTDFCVYLSGILLAGLLANAMFGWWWADPLAGLAMSPIIAREGMLAFKGKHCESC